MNTPCIAGAMLLGLLALPVGATGFAAPAAGQAAATPGTAMHAQSFDDWVTVTLVEAIEADPKYHKIPLDTRPAAEEFGAWMLAMWMQRITPADFKQRVDRKYPGHDYEADFIVAHLPPVARRAPQ